MENELYWKKVYTVAYRLTGNESNASELASLAIIHAGISGNRITTDMFKATVVELINIFLKAPEICYNIDECADAQNALLSLSPVCRAAVIWKDILGFQILDNIPAANYSRQELLRELVCGRRELKEYLADKIPRGIICSFI